MKKLLYVSCLSLFLALPLFTKAATYPTSASDATPLKSGNCTLVSTTAEKSSLTVYTLNPTHTQQLAQLYAGYWGRWPGCGELQFQVDHNTTLTRLKAWLISVEKTRIQNVNLPPYLGQTVSTLRSEWFLIKNGKRYLIPDLPTALAWGLLVGDRKSVHHDLTDYFYNQVPNGGVLQFTAGQHYTQINDVWKNSNFTQAALPARLQTELNTTFVKDAFTYKNPCNIGTYFRGIYCKLMNFDWASQNGQTYSF